MRRNDNLDLKRGWTMKPAVAAYRRAFRYNNPDITFGCSEMPFFTKSAVNKLLCPDRVYEAPVAAQVAWMCVYEVGRFVGGQRYLQPNFCRLVNFFVKDTRTRNKYSNLETTHPVNRDETNKRFRSFNWVWKNITFISGFIRSQLWTQSLVR